MLSAQKRNGSLANRARPEIPILAGGGALIMSLEVDDLWVPAKTVTAETSGHQPGDYMIGRRHGLSTPWSDLVEFIYTWIRVLRPTSGAKAVTNIGPE